MLNAHFNLKLLGHTDESRPIFLSNSVSFRPRRWYRPLLPRVSRKGSSGIRVQWGPVRVSAHRGRSFAAMERERRAYDSRSFGWLECEICGHEEQGQHGERHGCFHHARDPEGRTIMCGPLDFAPEGGRR